MDELATYLPGMLTAIRWDILGTIPILQLLYLFLAYGPRKWT